ncbi:MAG TPA: DUF488 family protein [Bellilinea sp.]|nr:DUF488 family protein [Bellilinea sp.]
MTRAADRHVLDEVRRSTLRNQLREGQQDRMAARLKRVYAPAEPGDGCRILVDRLWPRGLARERARVNLWLKDIAPSNELRNWFSHDPKRWRSFCIKYFREIDSRPDALGELLKHLRNGPVTLLYAAREERYNHAVALNEYLSSPRK